MKDLLNELRNEEWEIGKKYIVADTEEELEVSEREYILVAFSPNFYYPFVCVREEDEECYNNGEKYYTVSWKYAKPIPEKKYKQYEKANYAWIDKKVVDNFGTVSTIKMVGKDCVNFTENDKEETCYDLFKRYTWEDGSVCGEEL